MKVLHGDEIRSNFWSDNHLKPLQIILHLNEFLIGMIDSRSSTLIWVSMMLFSIAFLF